MRINTYLNVLKQKGNMAYEYNPFFNYQTNENLIEKDGFLIPEGKAVDKRNGKILMLKDGNWIDQDKNVIEPEYVLSYEDLYNFSSDYNFITKDSLINLDTQQLNFDINHPVSMEVQPSYDGSVNLIINDNKNTPRLINSRFSTREKNTYEIVDRIGENDTNIYSSNSFDKDTSLYFQYKTNPKIKYKKFIDGVLPVGQYCFYFTYCDADDNESDFIGESGLIPVFIGFDGDPFSMDGGIKNQNSNKGIQLHLTKLDSSYNYLKVYYVRYFADYQQNRVYECKKIYQKYAINSNRLTLQITGNENTEDLDPSILNAVRFNAKSILTQAQCKNMLFFGNIVKNYDDYRELQDCALRIIPECVLTTNVIKQDKKYSKDGYYNSYNMYSNVGYFNNEYYRFGVVFIYNNGTLSNVYNTLGYNTNYTVTYVNDNLTGENNTREYIKIDDEGWIINQGEYDNSNGIELNSRGVCKILKNSEGKNIKIRFNIPKEVSDYLFNNLGIRGLFFVRQKRIPNLLGQCYILPMDTVLQAPVLKIGNEYKTESYVTQEQYKFVKYKALWWNYTKKIVTYEGRIVNNEYNKRLYTYGNPDSISNNSYAAICPDFLLNQPYYNQIFNGSKFKLQKATQNGKLKQSSNNSSRYYEETNSIISFNDPNYKRVTICSVTEDVQTVALDKTIFKLEIGKAEEAFRFNYAQQDNGTYNAGGEDFDKINKSTNIVRGKYSPYLAISGNNLEVGELYNIYQDSYIDDNQQYLTRMNSYEPFYAISDRYNWEELEESTEDSNFIQQDCFRGDCYYNAFTYRLNRNFNDSSLPNNDQIIDKYTWRDHYKADNPSEFKNISRSDVNAVQLGSWITLEVMSSYNYALRSEDGSYVSEAALMGSPRSFYPRKQSMWLGNYKMPDSYLYNDAYRASLGFKCYYTIQDTNYVKNSFSNRIQYSAIAIQDSFKNNYRESYSTYFRDYSQEYGSIQKLVEYNGNLLIIFEHAIGLAAINERILAGNGDGGEVFINTKNVLPEELLVITNTYGTQWPESVIKSESGYVYGVDTIAKKIWRVKGNELELLSDFKVNKFLIDNISLGERELYPIIGIKNVKTHYNNNKKDIMFTFYDDIYQDEEKVWNLCFNELMNTFTTFYSWVPSYSENIDTQFFTFDRTTSKALSMLDLNNYANFSNTGVLLNSPIMKDIHGRNGEITHYTTQILYRDPATKEIVDNSEIGYKLLRDNWGYYKYFYIYLSEGKTELRLNIENYQTVINLMQENNQKIVILYIRPTTYSEIELNGNSNIIQYKTQQVILTFKEILNNLKFDFYLHGKAGIFNVTENLYPTYWYGEFHPFEFEFVVNDKIGQQKIFSNLEIISNKAEPESFHFEIEGDNYDFSADKRNMYFRQEATKNIFQNLGSNMLYDRNYTEVTYDNYTYEQYYRGNTIDPNTGEQHLYKNYEDNGRSSFDRHYPVQGKGLVQQVKSSIFPLYYEKIDTYNDIYHRYREMLDGNSNTGYDFKNLSGSEIKWERDLNQFNVVTHIKNSPIPLVGRLRGNSYYKEGKWCVQIPSIIFSQKNESPWEHIDTDFVLNLSELNGGDLLSQFPANLEELEIPPLVLNSSNIPEDLNQSELTYTVLPDIYQNNQYSLRNIDTSSWTHRKETKIRDKWIKIRVRYSGKNLAVIHSLITLYNISYA